jgi:hypothetical protein
MALSSGIEPFLGEGLTASWMDGLVALSRFPRGMDVIGRTPPVACTEVQLSEVIVVELLARLMTVLCVTNVHVSNVTNSMAQYKMLVPWWSIDRVVNVRLLTLAEGVVLLKSLCAWHSGRHEAIKQALEGLDVGTVPERMCLRILIANAFAGDVNDCERIMIV